MRGVGNVKIPMFIVLGTVLLNLILDPLFIFGYGPFPSLGVAGAALATIITQGLSALAGLLILFYGKREINIRLKELRFDFSLIKKMFLLGFPSSIEQSTRALGMIVITFLVASFGTVIVAAFGIGSRMLSLVIIPSMGLSMATSTLVGQNIGAGKTERAEKTVKISALVGFVSLTVMGLFIFLFAESLSSFFLPGEAEAISSSVLFIKLMALTFGFIGLHMVISGAFRGAGSTLVSMMLSIIPLWVLEFPLAYILSKHTGLAEVGLWIAFPVANIIGSAISVFWFLKGSWKQKRITEEIKIAKEVSEEAIIEEGL